MKTLIQFLFVLFFAVQSYAAASVRLYFIDPFTGSKDTNVFYITPIGTNVLSNGGVVTKGIPRKVTPSADGNSTNTLAVGHYSVTNRSLGSGIVIRVPDTSTFYDYTNLLVSGYNIFVTIENGEASTSTLNTNTIRILTSTNSHLLDEYLVRAAGQVTADGDWVFGGALSGDAISSWSVAADGDAEFNDIAATNITATSLAGPVLNQMTNIASGSSVSAAQVAAIMATNNAAGATNLYGGTLNLYVTNLASFVGGQGSAIPTGANKFNHVFSGTNNLITGSTSIFNVIFNGTGGAISDSIYSTMIGANNPGGTVFTINDSTLATIISANDAYIYHSYGSAIVGGEHIGIVGSAANASDGFNAVVGGDIIYIGDEFDTTSIVNANAGVGGYSVRMTGHAIQNANIGGAEKYFYNATNAASVGGDFHSLTGRGAVAIGSYLTNAENHEVMLGKFGTEVRISTNGFTTLKKMSTTGGVTTGNITNQSSWTIGSGGVSANALYTNGLRRGFLYWSGQSAEFGADIITELVTYDQGGSNTNRWGKNTVRDTDGTAWQAINGIPVSPSQVYYVDTFGTSLSTEYFKIVYE